MSKDPSDVLVAVLVYSRSSNVAYGVCVVFGRNYCRFWFSGIYWDFIEHAISEAIAHAAGLAVPPE